MLHLSTYDLELRTAQRLARAAGALILKSWDTDFIVTHKGDGACDLVSEVDLAAEVLILEGLREVFPDDKICAEEESSESPSVEDDVQDDLAQSGSAELNSAGQKERRGERVWYVDPLDGTTNFTHGFPHFCTSIALVIDGQPVVGVIYEPLKQWTFHAILGGGAWLDERSIKVSQQDRVQAALMATGFPYDRHTSDQDNITQASKMLKQCQGLRRPGAAALDLAYLSAGWLDGYWEYKLQPWDIAAGLLLLTEAGGVFTDDLGGTSWLTRGALICSSTPQLHSQMKTILDH